MDKNAIKKFAVWARTELIARVSLKGVEYGITEDNIEDANADSVGGKVLTADGKKQRQALIAEINDKGYKQVMEEVAYTWFNRFSALRFMEVNGYLPSHVRVFTDEENSFKPQIITEAIHLDLDGLDMEKVYELKDAEKTEELYKYLLIVQCNALNTILPGMFQKIADYTELLLPDNLLREGSVIQQMIELIPEDDWKDAVQIIGWLYQYYNSEKKDDVFAALKKNVKITKENIPAATQLFTPDWIVRYMVENSLGRLWLEGHPDVKEQLLPTEEEQSAYAAGNRDPEDSKWHYYLEEAEQEPEVQAQLAEIRKEYAALTPDQLKVIDPCSGSGHILAYMFDVLMKIYESYGYTTREAVASIVENNLYGLDIDDRAYQLAYFAVMMKARQYNRRILNGENTCHVYAIQESNSINRAHLKFFGAGLSDLEKNTAKMQLEGLLDTLTDAKEYGSILTVTPQDWSALYARFAEIKEDIHISREAALRGLLPLVQAAEALAHKYDVVVTNPPYMGSSGMNAKLSDYIKKYYPDSKSDLFAVFIEHGNEMVKRAGFNCMVTMQSWMFLSSFEKMRVNALQTKTITNLMHMENMVMGIAFGTAVTVFQNVAVHGYKGTYNQIKLQDIENDVPKQFPVSGNRFAQVSTDNFSKIPGSPVAYGLSQQMLLPYSIHEKLLGEVAAPCAGLATGDNNIFQRIWYEVKFSNIGFGVLDVRETENRNEKWYPCNSGGDFRKWSTDDRMIVNWQNNGKEIKAFKNAAGKLAARPQNTQWYFKEGLTWNKLSSSKFAVKYKRTGFIFDDTSRSAFPHDGENLNYLIGLLCSNVTFEYLKALNPTMSFTNGDLVRIPITVSKEKTEGIANTVENNISLSKSDWDSFETSWDFKKHPLLPELPLGSECVFRDANGKMGSASVTSIALADEYARWESECNKRFNDLKANEEELNRIFIDIYGLQDELTPEVEDKDVTVRRADLGRDIRSLISYAVGCIFGRYSLDQPGLAYAGGDWNPDQYHTFLPDADNVIPITDEEYFTDDLTGLFVAWVKKVFGAGSLEDNLAFIAKALGTKGTSPRAVIRNYFLNGFYADHVKIYQKRPIYWLYDSGKQNGFKALIYMHRYNADTSGLVRADYLYKMEQVYESEIARMDDAIANGASREVAQATKRKEKLVKQLKECKDYDDRLGHIALARIPIDLDDGVKVNYEKVQTGVDGKKLAILAKI